LGFDFAPCADCPSYEELLSELPGQARDQMTKRPDDFAARIEQKIACFESVQGPRSSHTTNATPNSTPPGAERLSPVGPMS